MQKIKQSQVYIVGKRLRQLESVDLWLYAFGLYKREIVSYTMKVSAAKTLRFFVHVSNRKGSNTEPQLIALNKKSILVL